MGFESGVVGNELNFVFQNATGIGKSRESRV